MSIEAALTDKISPAPWRYVCEAGPDAPDGPVAVDHAVVDAKGAHVGYFLIAAEGRRVAAVNELFDAAEVLLAMEDGWPEDRKAAAWEDLMDAVDKARGE